MKRGRFFYSGVPELLKVIVNNLTVLRKVLEAWAFQEMSGEKALAAQKLLDQIESLGSIYKQSYVVESTQIRKLIDIFDKPEGIRPLKDDVSSIASLKTNRQLSSILEKALFPPP